MAPQAERKRGRPAKSRREQQLPTKSQIDTEPSSSAPATRGKRSSGSIRGRPAKRARGSRNQPSEIGNASPAPHNDDGEDEPQSQHGFARSPPEPNAEAAFENIPLELIKGNLPAIRPKISGRGLDYVPLVKGQGDWDKPDLIRIIIVHPGADNQPLECELKIRLLPLLDARGKAKATHVPGIPDSDLPILDYVALSYAWEGQTPTEAILIHHPTGSLTLLVTENLKAALIALRHTSEHRHFWADAICMDQDNNVEKSQQLPLMSRIYSEAKEVCVWLGKEGPGASKAFDLMGKIRVWQDFKTVVEENTTCEEWIAFIELLSRSWFKRRWVVQEIVLAGRAELRCGQQRIEWMHFAQAVAFFEAMSERVKTKFRRNEKYENDPDKFGEVKEFSASHLVKVTADIVSRRDDGHVVQKTESLESLISTLTPFETGEPKDIVYAILSLAKDVNATAADVTLGGEVKISNLPEDLRGRDDQENAKILRALNQIMRNMRNDRFPVNYDKDFNEVCDDLYKFTTLHSSSLDLICRPWCPKVPDNGSMETSRKLPTWVRPLKDRAFQLDKEGHVVRKNADTLVGLPDRSPYRAAGRLRGEWRFRRDGGTNGAQILSAKGFQLDIVTQVEDIAHGGTIPGKWLEYKLPVGSSSNNSTLTPDPEVSISAQFWRTMVAGKGTNGQNPPPSYFLVCQELFDESSAINLQAKRNRTTNDVLKGLIDRVLAIVWGRRLARTSKHKRLALLPELTKAGDTICILYGCSVPVVLRRLEEKTMDGHEMWELIGECYVYEMMAGEALVIRREGSQDDPEFYQNKRFEIR